MSPVQNGVGYSNATPDKQDGLQKILQMHMSITQAVMNKHGWVDPKYIYIDAYCGDGEDHSDVNSSPIVFLKCLKDYVFRYTSKIEIWFIDKNPANIESLRSKMKTIPSCLHIECEDSTIYVPQIAKKFVRNNSFGILYIDPNTVPDMGMLEECSRLMPRIDFLIRMNCTGGKRKQKKVRVSDIISKTKKTTWLIRRPLQGDIWQWTFLFGTNFSNITAWEKAGFYRLDSLEGQDILNHFQYTNQEKIDMGITIDLPVFEKNENNAIESYNLF